MEERSIYRDISTRTGGQIYIGVVGGVRTGKSTFIKRFMDTLVIPNIPDENLRKRATDELPQSSAGRTIMTTEPKFIPEEAACVRLQDNVSLNVRMIDCVGYIVPSALGYIENEQPRMVKTPWYDEEIPFNMAAEIGTQKVINEHSTVGVVVTTDGSVTDIPREEYEEAEERVINELRQINKPFIVLVNCIDPTSPEAVMLAEKISSKHSVSAIPVNCLELDENEIKRILAQMLFEFPLKEIGVDIPKWVTSLENGHRIKSEIYSYVKSSGAAAERIRQISDVCSGINKCACVQSSEIKNIDLGTGKAVITVVPKQGLFWEVLSESSGMAISDEADMLRIITELTQTKTEFDKIKKAYDDVTETGYGIVMPTIEELTLEEPQIIKQGTKYGIKLRASAPSIHMMKTNITTEITPIVGSEQQSEELVMSMLDDFEDDPVKIWQSNIFGKSLHELVNEGLHNKLYRMPAEARMRMNETVERIINDGCNGLICIIL